MDWTLGLREGVPEPDWTSSVAALSVLLDLTIGMAPAMGGMMGGSEWGRNELDEMAGAMREEILRTRAQPGSG